MAWNVSGSWNVSGEFGSYELPYYTPIVGLVDGVKVKYTPVTLFDFSDNFLVCTVQYKDGTAVSTDLFREAFYSLADQLGEVKITADMTSGVSFKDGKILIHIDDALLDFNGQGMHQLVVITEDGHKLPPVFLEKVKIISTLQEAG
ncbi:hypothetical protein [Alteromonas mediterranea]|uniref:Uncharacterized protein n=1 Tax=Alteromonas mediterranea (strain DSM 17117 / CIP 110805 / LMG 28347 / Deep ecotype) TaxID=1774373 RepID=F2GC83_ALTMD|nr:hypothetical protein [Alteromonas mediterranea]AEA99039.1 hypothetical protein MADE_1014525 [Alteromonas mediterranea DE]